MYLSFHFQQVRFAKDLNISSKDASYLFIYIGITSTVSRILAGQVIDKKWLTPLQVVRLFSLIMGIAIIVFAFAKEYSHFVIYSVVYGITSGGFITSQNVFLQSILEPEKSAIGLGMGYMVFSVAVAGGPPFVGKEYKASVLLSLLHNSYGHKSIHFSIIEGRLIFVSLYFCEISGFFFEIAKLSFHGNFM